MHLIIASIVYELPNLKLILISENSASEKGSKKEPIEQGVHVWHMMLEVQEPIQTLETKAGNAKKWKQSYFSPSSF